VENAIPARENRPLYGGKPCGFVVENFEKNF
jgi:hypothetical protein